MSMTYSDPAAIETRQYVPQGHRPGGRVEGLDPLRPAFLQPFGLLGQQPRARRDDEQVVFERGPAVGHGHARAQIQPLDRGAAEADSRMQLAVAWPGDLVRVGQADGTNSRPGW